MSADMSAVIQEWVGAILLTLIIAFFLPIVFVITLRYTEKYDRESWRDLLSSFIWGATVSVVAVILIRGWFLVEFRTTFPLYYQYIAAIVVTPVAAELIKSAGLFFNRDAITESEDGLIHGGTIGLGYAAAENLLYGIFLFTTFGFRFFVITMVVRSFSVVLINCTTTALVCYGITRFTARTHTQRSWYFFPLFYLAAVGISGTFNFLALTGERLFGTATMFSYSISLIFAITLAVILAFFIYFKIYRLDRLDSKPKGGPPPQEGYQQRTRYRPPPAQSRNVQTGYVPRGGMGRPPPRGQQRPPPRRSYQQPPPRRSLGPQGPPPARRQQQRPPPRQQQKSPPRQQQRPPSRQQQKPPPRQPQKPPSRLPPKPSTRPPRPQRPPPPKPSRGSRRSKFELDEEEEELEFKPRSSSRKSGKKPTFEVEEEVEFKPRSKSKGSSKKSSSMDWEDDDYDDDWS
jgi:RsiW-degrading membrane proteinase PrsW (M82 family)